MKKIVLIGFCFLMVAQLSLSQSQVQDKTERETENGKMSLTSRFLIENWTGVYYHGSGTPYPMNRRITIFMNDMQVGFNLLKSREKFFGPFFRNRITYEPKKYIPWFNIVENTIGLKVRPGIWQVGVEIASLKYLPKAQFENIGGMDWDLIEKDRSEYTALRIFGSLWDGWSLGKKKIFSGEEWVQIYYHGPGTKDINKNNVIAAANAEANIDIVRFDKRYETYKGKLQLVAMGAGAIDTKRFPWNNFYEGMLGLQVRYSSFKFGVVHVWGNFHDNAKFNNIGGKGWDMNPERPYRTWRVFVNLWLSYSRDR